MKKVWMSIAVLALVGMTYLGLKPILFPHMEGSKTIELKMVLNDTNILFEESVQTDALTLGELIEEVDSFYEEISVEYSGSKTDAYGRMLLAINENKTLDMSTGPWWLVESDNNVDCLAAGYCNGIDLQSIYDLDHFTLNFTSSY
jgi:hypothetical protein